MKLQNGEYYWKCRERRAGLQSFMLGSVVGIANSLWTGRSGVWIPTVSRDFLFFKTSRLALGFFYPPIQWVPRLFPRVKAAGSWSWYVHLVLSLRITPNVGLYGLDRECFTDSNITGSGSDWGQDWIGSFVLTVMNSIFIYPRALYYHMVVTCNCWL